MMDLTELKRMTKMTEEQEKEQNMKLLEEIENKANVHQILLGYPTIITCEQCELENFENCHPLLSDTRVSHQSLSENYFTYPESASETNDYNSSMDVHYCGDQFSSCCSELVDTIPDDDELISIDEQPTVQINQPEIKDNEASAEIYCECKKSKSPPDEIKKSFSKERCSKESSYLSGKPCQCLYCEHNFHSRSDHKFGINQSKSANILRIFTYTLIFFTILILASILKDIMEC